MPKKDFAHVDTWVFDMDHTLYPADNRLFSQIEVRMSDYFSAVTDLPVAQADQLRLQYWNDYGSSVAGLIKHHRVDADAFLQTVHDIDFAVLTPNIDLKDAIKALPGRKIVFTNGPIQYAKNVLQTLDLADIFDATYGTEHCDLVPKPQRRAYEMIIERACITSETTAMFEDSHHNLIVPHEMGMKTVLVHHDAEADHIHHCAPCLPSFLRRLI